MPADTLKAEVDVLVIGAGPGGSAAAFHLASHGLDVLMVERSSFPREKACGDGLTPRGVKQIQAMGMDPLGPGFERVDGLRVYHYHEPILHICQQGQDLLEFQHPIHLYFRHRLAHTLVYRSM